MYMQYAYTLHDMTCYALLVSCMLYALDPCKSACIAHNYKICSSDLIYSPPRVFARNA